jgi:hypothetical protein
MAIISVAIGALFLRKPHRDQALFGAAILAVTHLVTLYSLFNPS